jgi:hypothetical protein
LLPQWSASYYKRSKSPNGAKICESVLHLVAARPVRTGTPNRLRREIILAEQEVAFE